MFNRKVFTIVKTLKVAEKDKTLIVLFYRDKRGSIS